MTQCDALLDHLKRGRCISDMDALRHLGIRRLAARVCDLRERGWNVETHMVNVRTRDGHARDAVYTLPAHAR